MYARASADKHYENDVGKDTRHVLMLGVVLEVTGAFDYIEEFAHAGITVPITGFGSNLAKGAIKGVKEDGILGAVKGGMSAVSSGLSAAIFFGFIFSLIFKAKTKES